MTKKKKLKSLSAYRKDVWDLQSKVIRKSAANFQDLAPCYTCYQLFPWKELQAGHYKHRSYDFDRRHIKPQCARCNCWGHGMSDEFYVHLVKEYGQEIADELRIREHKNKYTRLELEEIMSGLILEALEIGL